MQTGANHVIDHQISAKDEVEVDRRFVIRAVVALLASSAAGVGVAAAVIAKDDDKDDDNDNSGHGGDDDDHDNSGKGSGGDDHDDVNDDHDDEHGGDPRVQAPAIGVTEVQILDEVFVPNHIRIETGQTVTWTNLDDDDHTASGRGMDTGIMIPGGRGSVTFLEPGEFDYICNFHPEMRGLVVVIGESRATPEASPVALPMSADVEIVDLAFESADVIVGTGALVTWTNTGQLPHTVTGSFADSGILDPGARFEFAFEEPGRFEYACLLHPGMTGTIDVRDGGSQATPVAEPHRSSDVTIVDFAFEPAEVTIGLGGVVTWTNAGQIPHSATGTFGDSGILDAGGAFEFTFDVEGTYEYACVLHPNMIGRVVVGS
jgi:plastocyanin